MEQIMIVRPSVDEYVQRVLQIANRYEAHWLDLYLSDQNVELDDPMEREDRDDFMFYCIAFWEPLMKQEMGCGPPTTIRIDKYDNPGSDPGFSFGILGRWAPTAMLS